MRIWVLLLYSDDIARPSEEEEDIDVVDVDVARFSIVPGITYTSQQNNNNNQNPNNNPNLSPNPNNPNQNPNNNPQNPQNNNNNPQNNNPNNPPQNPNNNNNPQNNNNNNILSSFGPVSSPFFFMCQYPRVGEPSGVPQQEDVALRVEFSGRKTPLGGYEPHAVYEVLVSCNVMFDGFLMTGVHALTKHLTSANYLTLPTSLHLRFFRLRAYKPLPTTVESTQSKVRSKGSSLHRDQTRRDIVVSPIHSSTSDRGNKAVLTGTSTSVSREEENPAPWSIVMDAIAKLRGEMVKLKEQTRRKGREKIGRVRPAAPAELKPVARNSEVVCTEIWDWDGSFSVFGSDASAEDMEDGEIHDASTWQCLASKCKDFWAHGTCLRRH
ncbi:hypothetical protein Pcinc_042075 [Petrolisthes cinctipes]|uniref:Uncharacterized protein n=1 Tax=Petrolisthes cinctipes TaxID=88211 RepID=A0AAE1EH85_PETCI|nr:hypothetical protein Pcinc_042075 [Petrolisthes cinctipes]